MNVVVTGAAGFIGSHLSAALLSRGYDVVGLDSFTDYYDPHEKRKNIQAALEHPHFRLVEADLERMDLDSVLAGCDVVYHLAGQPGVRASWGDDFRLYLERNIWATQRILEALRRHHVSKLVFASSSSVYGDAERYPTQETDLPQPISPYGMTKLACEGLCMAYSKSFPIPFVALRYFTVYGPRQRPDMAFSRFIRAIQVGQEITVYGDGLQLRDFTYVADTVEATIRAGECEAKGEILNVGGGSQVSLLDAIKILGESLGVEPRLRFVESQQGDVRQTGADPGKAERILGYRPHVALSEGLRAQVLHATGEVSRVADDRVSQQTS